jgi:hypothetical protein
MRHVSLLLAPAVLLALSPAAPAQTDLQRRLKDTQVRPHWIYDDIPAGFEQARATGKPLLVLFR